MGVLRSFSLVIAAVFLFIALLLGGIFATLNSSLTYENVQPKINSIATQVINEQIGAENITSEIIPLLQTQCQGNSTQIVRKFEGYTFEFPCEIVSQGEDAIINHTINYLVEDFYYKDYNCSFLKCFEETDVPLFLVSEYAKNYWNSLFYKTLIIIIILTGFIFLFTEKKSNTLILPGALLIGSSLIISQLNGIGTWIAKLILSPISVALTNENSRNIITQVVEIFFSESTKIFLWFFILGLILIATGIVFKLTSFGFKIKEWIDKRKSKDKIEELEENQKEIKEKLHMNEEDKKTKKDDDKK